MSWAGLPGVPGLGEDEADSVAGGPSGHDGDALAAVAACTARAAAWVGHLADRQPDPAHGRVLQQFAEAVARVGSDLDPGDGYLGGVDWQTRSHLDGYVLLGARRCHQPVDLEVIEAVAVGAVAVLALALPAAAMFDVADLPRVCALIDQALAAGRACRQQDHGAGWQ
ncbi:hypothetical protein [Kitasatospora aureofaciens]|uniref:hypothetical protein n=1 Tax=Kitasatospora aureofaciens TaxID=1894 RepID=UPI0037CA2E1B